MRKKIFTTKQVEKITGASRHEPIEVKFCFAPPFLDALREYLKSNLVSRGGRPAVKGTEIVRKVHFSKKLWDKLNQVSATAKEAGCSLSPAQVATLYLEKIDVLTSDPNEILKLIVG